MIPSVDHHYERQVKEIWEHGDSSNGESEEEKNLVHHGYFLAQFFRLIHRPVIQKNGGNLTDEGHVGDTWHRVPRKQSALEGDQADDVMVQGLHGYWPIFFVED